MELIVEGRGTFLAKHQGRLRVSREQKMVTEVPLIHLDRVLIIDNGVAISSDVVRVCSEEGIPIHFVGSRGNAIASLYSAGLTGTVMTRRAQLLAYETPLGVSIAKAFITGKLENQANLLRYMAKYRKETESELLLTTVYNCAQIKLTDPRDGCKLWEMLLSIPTGDGHDQEQDSEYDTRIISTREVHSRHCDQPGHRQK